jgi:hypothetical protein
VLLAAKAASPLAVLGNLSAGFIPRFPPSLVTMIERKSAMDRHCYSFLVIPKFHAVIKLFLLFS